MTAAQTAQIGVNEPVSWETKPASTQYQPSLPGASMPPVIPKTVDYGHGHGKSSKYKYILYHFSKKTQIVFQDVVVIDVNTLCFRAWSHC